MYVGVCVLATNQIIMIKNEWKKIYIGIIIPDITLIDNVTMVNKITTTKEREIVFENAHWKSTKFVGADQKNQLQIVTSDTTCHRHTHTHNRYKQMGQQFGLAKYVYNLYMVCVGVFVFYVDYKVTTKCIIVLHMTKRMCLSLSS